MTMKIELLEASSRLLLERAHTAELRIAELEQQLAQARTERVEGLRKEAYAMIQSEFAECGIQCHFRRNQVAPTVTSLIEMVDWLLKNPEPSK